MGNGETRPRYVHAFYVELLAALQQECEKHNLSFRHEMGRLIHSRLVELDPLYADDYFPAEIQNWLEP